ncbi:MAG: tRNA preQ1(34) S-adenosylmethionine ribosyltransferase-isomerase QueA [Gammaproteobacteria bacterium]|nr:tRNA preQ1(34) S-adenosylmethionine ribosyltransferase-isomerase QueA [Gammaproteobacteria bacterium]
MQLTDFQFELSPDLIARYPLKKRSASRLLCLNSADGNIAHRQFSELLNFLEAGDLLVFNDTKVIPARIMGKKSSGGQVEIFVERILDDQRILAQVRASKAPRIGDYLLFSHAIRLEIIQRQQQFYELRCPDIDRPILEIIETIGQIPLPPYLHRLPDEEDKERYQTVYAKHKGSVAAPTAGLHFDHELLAKLTQKNIDMAYLTLHIGAGTFSPVRVENIIEHQMHAEYFEVHDELCMKIKRAKVNGKRVIAVGTTSLRALETASQQGQIDTYQGETSIFIYPGYTFRCVDALITNLHLPRSTLLMLVCAFGGHQHVMQAYQAAVEQRYRFYSYGDAMWIDNKTSV